MPVAQVFFLPLAVGSLLVVLGRPYKGHGDLHWGD